MARGDVRAGFCAFVAAAVLALPPSAAGAQDADETVMVSTMVLRATRGVDEDVAAAVDEELARSLRDVAGLEPAMSPVPFEELRVAAGCGDELGGCLAAIAATLEVEALLLRRLTEDGGRLSLALVRYDPEAQGELPRVDVRLEPGALAGSVDRAVRRFFGIPEPPLAARRGPGVSVDTTPEPQAPPPADGGVSPATIVVLGAGTLILAGGAVAGVLSLVSQSDYEETTVATRDDADRALDRLDAAETQATVANVLFMVGGAVALAGGLMLALDLGIAKSETPGAHASLRLGAAPGALALLVDGRWGAP